VDVLPIVRVGANSTDKITVEELGTLFGGGGLEGSQYIYVAANGTDVENAAELQAAYDLAKTLSPSADNVITVIVAPGTYKFPLGGLILDTEYIDLVSLTGNTDVIFDIDISDPFIYSGNNITDVSYCLEVKENNIYVKGIKGKLRQSTNFNDYWWEGTDYILPIKIQNNLPNIIIENCIGGWFSFGGDFTFFSNPVNISGTFINCQAGWYSFGSGSTGSEASGTFINCKSSAWSFGQQGTASGYFENCEGTASFGRDGVASGTFINCKDNGSGFGRSGTSSGLFINCQGANGSFSGFSGIIGKVYYCRLSSGTFDPVSGSGKTIYCIDSNGEPNNQGFTPQNNL